MRDGSDRYQVQTVSMALSGGYKRLGSYLVEAGLLTQAQIDVALNDQKVTGMKFGEVLAARGWVKQKTIEYLMTKVVEPEREALKPPARHELKGAVHTAQGQPSSPSPGISNPAAKAKGDRRPPIGKPLPSVPPRDEGVNWVG